MNSFDASEKRLLRNGNLYIVRSDWLEESAERKERVPEETYSLKPMLELLNISDG